jgi:ATP-binding cassette, subfamily B, bacterial PglK
VQSSVQVERTRDRIPQPSPLRALTPTTPATNPPPSTRTLLLGIWGHLSRRRRIQLGLLLVVMLASGVAELVSLGAVLPFLAVLSDPERLWQQPQVQALAGRVGFTQASELLLPATLVFAVAAVLAAAVGSDLSCEAYRRTLYPQHAVAR